LIDLRLMTKMLLSCFQEEANCVPNYLLFKGVNLQRVSEPLGRDVSGVCYLLFAACAILLGWQFRMANKSLSS